MKRRIINKIVLGLIWSMIPLLFLASILVFFELWNSKINIIKQLIVIFYIFLILTFAFILIILSTKYRKEMLLNDTERKKRWKFLRKDFRDFSKKMIIFNFILFISTIISGVFMLFDNNPDKLSGILLIIVGVVLLAGTFKPIKELIKSLKRLEVK